MPKVTLHVKNLDSPLGYPETIKVVEYPLEMWDIAAVKKSLEESCWYQVNPSAEYNPLDVLMNDIETTLGEFDGMNLGFMFEFRSIPEEQRNPGAKSRLGPGFTGRYDFADYLAFYLAVTSAAGIDESITVERAAEYVIEGMENGTS
jgi:hypothetical protein